MGKTSPRFSTSLSMFKFSSSSKSAVCVDDLKADIRRTAKGKNNGITSTKEERSIISELAKKLEKVNPTKKLTTSPLMNGKWNLVYTTNEGSSAGKIGQFVGSVNQVVDLESGIYLNNVEFGAGIVKGSLKASWDVLDTRKWTVKFETIKFSLFGIPLVMKPLDQIGTWRMSYQDPDFRILYAQGGKNKGKENIYILSKN